MKKNISIISFALILNFMAITIFLSSVQASETFKLDPVHSFVVFRVKHLDVSYAYGRFNEPTGTFILDRENPEKSSVELKIETQKIDTFNEKRDQHLRSPDFFNAKQFPVILFKSKSIRKMDKDSFDVTGDLTLMGVSKTVTLRVQQTGSGKDPWGSFREGFESTFTVKRSDYGMKFMLGPVSDEVRITVSVEGIRQ